MSEMSSSVTSSVTAVVTPTPVAEVATPVATKAAPIPSMVSGMSLQDQEALASFAKSKKKYNITALPEATCDGCQ
jgi:hypothetical protein